MSWLPVMMWMHTLNDDELDQPKQGQDPEEQYSTRYNAEDAPVVTEICPPVTADPPAAANSINNTQCTPTVAPRSWHYTAMSAATFALSAFLGYIATETIFKRIRGRN